MSFASDVKTELAKLKIDDCCKKASLSALLQLAGEISINSSGCHVTLKTMNNTIARFFISLVKELYDLPVNIIMSKQNLTKSDVFNIVVDDAKQLITDYDLFNSSKMSLLNIIDTGNASSIIVVLAMLSLTVYGGYFFLRKKKEQ